MKIFLFFINFLLFIKNRIIHFNLTNNFLLFNICKINKLEDNLFYKNISFNNYSYYNDYSCYKDIFCNNNIYKMIFLDLL